VEVGRRGGSRLGRLRWLKKGRRKSDREKRGGDKGVDGRKRERTKAQESMSLSFEKVDRESAAVGVEDSLTAFEKRDLRVRRREWSAEAREKKRVSFDEPEG